jgi:hypothetical protein
MDAACRETQMGARDILDDLKEFKIKISKMKVKKKGLRDRRDWSMAGNLGFN